MGRRLIKKLALLAILVISLLNVRSAFVNLACALPAEVFLDDFERYDTGAFPDAQWDLVFNGVGTEHQIVVDHVSNSPTKSLQLVGSRGWSADAVSQLSTSSPTIGYEVYVMIGEVGVSNLTDGRVGFWEKTSSTTAEWYVAVSFLNNGTIYSGGKILQPCSPGVWYKVRLIYDRENNLYSVWVDDVLRGENLSYPGYDPYALEAFALSSSCYNDAKVYFDDVKLFFEPPAIGAIYIRADGSVEPSTAPISSIDNVTYTLTGNITINTYITRYGIVVERDDIVISGAGYAVRGTRPYIGESQGIWISKRSNVTIKNIEIRAFLNGIRLNDSKSNTISGSNITDNSWGIYLNRSSDNTISENNLTNSWGGIWLGDYSTNNAISGNQITNLHVPPWGTGISLKRFAEQNSICENHISKNTIGIHLYGSKNNIFTSNTISENHWGIGMEQQSNDNILHHNSFVDNNLQVLSSHSTNVWDNGFKGNYWSDYTGTDLHHGPYQNETGSDGIGDTPYTVGYGPDRDNYPLMKAWNWPLPADINYDFSVDMKDIDIATEAFGTEPGDPQWNPHADITGPEHLIPDSKVDMRDIGLIAHTILREDFTTYIEVDPENRISRSTTRVTWTQMDRQQDGGAYVYKDFGSGYFSDFTHNFDVTFLTVEAGDLNNRLIVGLHVLAQSSYHNETDKMTVYAEQLQSHDDMWYFVFHQRIDETTNSFVWVGAPHGINTTYYCTVSKQEDIFRFKVFADAERTVLLEDSGNKFGIDKSYRYLIVAQGRDFGVDIDDYSSGYIENLCLGELAQPQKFDISAQYSTFVNARANYMQIFGQNVSVGETVERDLSGCIDDPSLHYEWVTWAGHTYPSFDGLSIRIETIQPDYVYKVIGRGHVGGSQPSTSGWIQVNAPFEIKQLNYIRNSTPETGRYFRIYIDVTTGTVDFESRTYNYPALIDSPAFGFAFTIARPEGTLPPFSNDTSRAGASYAYDTSANRVVMYGGTTILEGDSNADALKSDVWTYDPATSQWTAISAPNDPSGRKYASMCYNSLANNFLVFGGSTNRGVSGDTWMFQFTDSTSGTWTHIADPGPSERRLASMAYDADDDLFVLFGGGNYVYTYGDTWLLNPTTNTWTDVTPPISPPQRQGATMAYDAQSGVILLFGGVNTATGSLLNDTWLYNATSNSWQQVYPMTTPSARLYPSLASDGNGHVYLFGGWNMDPNGLSNYLGDTWRFDIATMEWTELDPPSRPPPQSQGNLIRIGTSQFVLMNGWRDCPLGDIWFYNADENTWRLQ